MMQVSTSVAADAIRAWTRDWAALPSGTANIDSAPNRGSKTMMVTQLIGAPR